MDRRLILAMLLSFLIIMAYNAYNLKIKQDWLKEHPEYLEKIEEQQRQRAQPAPADLADATAERSAPALAALPEATTPSLSLVQTDLPRSEEIIRVTSRLYQVEIAAQGGRPVSWKLLEYEEILEDPALLENYRKKLAALSPQTPEVQRLRQFLDRKIEWTRAMQSQKDAWEAANGTDGKWPPERTVELVPTLWESTPPLSLEWADTVLDDYISYEASTESLEVQEGNQRLVLRGRNGPFEITKTFLFRPHDYVVDCTLSIHNVSDQVVNFPAQPDIEKSIRLTWSDGVGLDLFNDRWAPPVLFQISNKILAEHKVYKAQVSRESTILDWALLQNKYFAVCILPQGPIVPRVAKSRSTYDHGELDLVLNIGRLEPGQTRSEQFTLFIGPRDPRYLRQFGHGLGDILFRGFFWSIAKPFGLLFLWMLRAIHAVVFNWGVAIIVLTLITKAAMYPLMRKQMQSMKNMQRIQPMVKELEKYKSNQAKYQKELMALYKREKVNPAGGCLPLLLTMPIFIGLYLVIYIAPELRGASFLWIRDLSQQESLFSFYLPMMNWVVHFNLLPLLNGAVTYFTQKKQVVDPKQAGMMQMMPLIFIFIFWSFPSGVVLYWLIQTVLGAAQQSLFNRLHEKENAKGRANKKTSLSPLAARKASSKAKK